ncbi:MAG TPA: alpha/beta fold hydrolase [Novosphingobium sp.]
MTAADRADDRLAELEAAARTHATPCAGGSLVWRVWGEGEPLVLLHGAHGFWGHWVHTIPTLAARRTLWVPDLPGYGDSALPEGEDHAAFVHPLARALQALLPVAGPLDIVGFSFGGIIATHLAMLYPALVRRLVIIDPGGLGTPLGEFELRSPRGLEGAARDAVEVANLKSLMLHDPAKADALALRINRRGMAQARFHPGKLVMPDHLVTALAQCQAPLDAIWGALDRAHPDPAQQDAALRRFRPDLRFRVVPEAGHWCMYEQPAAFNAILQELLALPPA